MQDEPASSGPLRVLIVDDHEIYRTACRALLRTEGLNVVADLALGDQALMAAIALKPDVAIVDVSHGNESALDLARRLRALQGAPAVVLTSSSGRSALNAKLDGFGFIAKADICAEQIVLHLTSPRPEGRGFSALAG
jgi:DNA-binding NarL/FixJ family response regulator